MEMNNLTSIIILIVISMLLSTIITQIYKIKTTITKRDYYVALITFIILLLGFGIFKTSQHMISYNKKVNIRDDETIQVRYSNLDKTKILLQAIGEVESGNDSTAVCQSGSTSRGHLQITQILVNEVNRISKDKKYTYDDRFSKVKSEEMFHIIQKEYNPTGDIERGIRLWNGGSGYTKESTEGYYQKVMKVYNRLIDEELEKVVREVKTLNL